MRILTVLLFCATCLQAQAQDRPLPGAPMGLRADYYAAGDLDAGTIAVRQPPIFTRIELSLDSAPTAGLPAKFSVRWSGQIRIDESGQYVFHFAGGGNSRIWIDGEQILDDSSPHPARDVAGAPITLSANTLADVRIDYEPSAAAAPRLTWSRESKSPEAIDPSRLYPFGKPIRITAGGIYVGSWQSDDPKTASVTIATGRPVTIDHSTLRGRGVLIATGNPLVRLTVKYTAALGLDPGVPHAARGAFIDAYKAASLDIEHNFIEGVGGYGINVNDFVAGAGGTVKILHNQIRNIDGRFSDGNGQPLTTGEPTPHAIILQHVHNLSNVEIAWNEIIHDPYAGYVNDVINLYESSGTAESPIRVHDNYIQGLYAIDPLREYNSGCGIITDGGSDLARATAFVEISNNQVIATGNGGICVAAGHNIILHDNRILSSGRMPAGSIVFAQNVGSYIHAPKDATPATFFQNAAYDNLIGWNRPPRTFENKSDTPSRGDTWFPDADPVLTRNNQPWPDPITPAAELGEYDFWLKKISSEKDRPGIGKTPVAGTSSRIDLTGCYNKIAIAREGKAFAGAFGGSGFSAELLRSSLTIGPTVFSLGAPGTANAISAEGQTIPIDQKYAFAHLRFLSCAIAGNQPAQSFIVNYTDGSAETFAEEIADWRPSQVLAQRSNSRIFEYAIAPDGTRDNRPCSIYRVDLPLDVSKIPGALALPKNQNIVILAITLSS